jgi:HEAT repeat protein
LVAALPRRKTWRTGFLIGPLPVALCCTVVSAWLAVGQEARLVNAQAQVRSAASGLEQEFRSLVKSQVEAAWIGYAVPLVEGHHRICCYSSEDRQKPASLRRGRCNLEGRDEGMNFQTHENDEGDSPDHLLVLFRVADKSVGKIRVFTDDCELDAGGLPVYWLSDVKARESIELLAGFVGDARDESKTSRRKGEAAIAAIALHAGSAADSALERFVDAKRPEEMRKSTAFWLGNVRGQEGYKALRRLVREDPSEKVREQCIFALHISKVPEAVNAIIDLARADTNAHLRGQALFWLSQKAGEKAAKAIAEAIENDPQTEVKKKAVFALSQLPKAEGVAKLIEVARKNRNQEVRKDAMFWLGQSNDPRALAFFEEVLTH